MKRVLVNLTEEELAILENFAKKNKYNSKSQAFREAIKLLDEVGRTPTLREVLEKLRKRELNTTLRRLSDKEIIQKIISFLRTHTSGSIINEISAGTGLHRNTLGKYLAELNISKIIHQEKIGTSTISHLRISRRVKHD